VHIVVRLSITEKIAESLEHNLEPELKSINFMTQINEGIISVQIRISTLVSKVSLFYDVFTFSVVAH